MKLFLGLSLSALLFTTQVHASGCDNGRNVELGAKLTEITVAGRFNCWGPDNSGLYRCGFSSMTNQIPLLNAWWLEFSKLPATDTTLQTVVEVYAALIYNDCDGPDVGSPPNGYYYKALVNGIEYAGYKYYNELTEKKSCAEQVSTPEDLPKPPFCCRWNIEYIISYDEPQPWHWIGKPYTFTCF